MSFSSIYNSDFISIRSFKKKDVRSFSEQLVKDLNKLLIFLHKILYLRLLYYKISLCFSSLCSFSQFVSFFFSVNSFSFFFFRVSFLFRFIFFFSINIHNLYMYFFFYTNFFFYLFNFSFFNFFFLYYSYFYFFIFYFFFLSSILNNRAGISSLPTRIKKFTVLRSPHIDKKSREQFELRVHKRVVSFYSIYSSYFSYVCYLYYNRFLCQSVIQNTFFYYD